MTTWNNACPNLKSTPCHRSWRTAEICFISFMWSLWPQKRRISCTRRQLIWFQVIKRFRKTMFHRWRRSLGALGRKASNIWLMSSWINERKRRCWRVAKLNSWQTFDSSSNKGLTVLIHRLRTVHLWFPLQKGQSRLKNGNIWRWAVVKSLLSAIPLERISNFQSPKWIILEAGSAQTRNPPIDFD